MTKTWHFISALNLAKLLSKDMNKPFLKWAGGKYKVLPHILPLIGDATQYIEPFSGSLSVALNVNSQVCVLNDNNKDLIELYKCVISGGDSFIDECESYFVNGNSEEVFYQNRELFNASTDATLRSALFVYLNRHSFNGLTRYNRKGQYNVPFGRYKTNYFPRSEMQQFREVMKNKMLFRMTALDFEDAALYQNVTDKTVVYCDPPYIPLSQTANFTDYSADGFNDNDQVRLKNLALKLKERGARVIISNHDVPRARELYSDASKIIQINVNRSVSAKGTSRGKVGELLAVY